MPLRAVIREAIAHRKERQKGKRMALRLAALLAAVIAFPFGYWQYQLHTVLKQPKTTEELDAMCGKLDATLAKVKKEEGGKVDVNKDDLDYRVSECQEMGYDLTTGSVDGSTDGD